MHKLVVIFLLVAALPVYAIDVIEFRNAAEEQRFRDLSAELRCLVCQNQSLDDSAAPLAQDLRDEVLELMRAGNTDAQIKQYLVERYGDFVLYRPRFTAANLLLWLGPVLLLLGGVLLVFRSLRRMQKSSATNPDQEPDQEPHQEPDKEPVLDSSEDNRST